MGVMCSGLHSGENTPQARASAQKAGIDKILYPDDNLGALPGMKPTPDVTDELVRKRRAAAAFQAMTGSGRGATMITSGASPTVGSTGLGRTLLGGG